MDTKRDYVIDLMHGPRVVEYCVVDFAEAKRLLGLQLVNGFYYCLTPPNPVDKDDDARYERQHALLYG